MGSSAVLRAWSIIYPTWVRGLRSTGFATRLRTVASTWSPDIVQFEYPVMAQYVAALPKVRPPCVLVEHDFAIEAARRASVRPTDLAAPLPCRAPGVEEVQVCAARADGSRGRLHGEGARVRYASSQPARPSASSHSGRRWRLGRSTRPEGHRRRFCSSARLCTGLTWTRPSGWLRTSSHGWAEASGPDARHRGARAPVRGASACRAEDCRSRRRFRRDAVPRECRIVVAPVRLSERWSSR